MQLGKKWRVTLRIYLAVPNSKLLQGAISLNNRVTLRGALVGTRFALLPAVHRRTSWTRPQQSGARERMRNDIKSGELIPQIFFVLRKWESITGNREITAMNWDELEGKWKQYKGQIREKWGKLTDDDIHVIAGQREQLVGRLQERYGIAKEVAAKQADEFVKALTEEGVDDREVRRKAAGKA